MIYEDYHVAEKYFVLNKEKSLDIPWEDRLDGRHVSITCAAMRHNRCCLEADTVLWEF